MFLAQGQVSLIVRGILYMRFYKKNADFAIMNNPCTADPPPNIGISKLDGYMNRGHKYLVAVPRGVVGSDDVVCTYTMILSNLWYKSHKILKFKCFSSRLSVVCAQAMEARCYVENEDVVGAAPTGDAPTTSES